MDGHGALSSFSSIRLEISFLYFCVSVPPAFFSKSCADGYEYLCSIGVFAAFIPIFLSLA